MTANALPSNTETVNSRPFKNCSTTRIGSYVSASITALANCSCSFTIVTPILEPCVAGFNTTGKENLDSISLMISSFDCRLPL